MSSSANPNTTTTATRTESQIISAGVQQAIEKNMPLAMWRLPNDDTTYLLLANEYQPIEPGSSIESLASGFLFAPFDARRSAYHLPGNLVLTFVDGKLSGENKRAHDPAMAGLYDNLIGGSAADIIKPTLPNGNIAGSDHIDYPELVRKSIEAIAAGKIEKVVPSRTKHLALNNEFDIVGAFQKLRAAYPQALVSFVSIPDVGNWLGASPESLIAVEDGKVFKTVALAGTQPYREEMDLRSVAWTQKEIEEQALVERYVIGCFKKIRLREYEEHGPRTVVAGNLMHLKSDFSVDLMATHFPQLASVMLGLLHPTSAVCGMPLDNALDFLRKNEGYDREFYSGYLGPVNIANNINLFVNLRCMKLTGDQALLFAGAGVTADSEPMMEFAETELKFQTLLNVVF